MIAVQVFFYKLIYYFLEILKFYLVDKYILVWEQKKWNWKRLMIAVIALVVMVSFSAFFSEQISPLFIYIPFILVETFNVFRGQIWKLLSVSLTVMYAISAVDSMIYGMYEVLLEVIEKQFPIELLGAFTTILFLGFVAYAMHCKLQGYFRKIPARYYILFIFLATGNGIILGEFQRVFERGNIGIRIAYIFIVLGIFLELALLLILAATREVYKEKDLLNQKYLKWQEEHYTYLEQRETATKKFRHDMRNHIYILQHLLEQEKLEEAKQYADELEEHFTSMGTAISVNHGIVDAILNKYAAKCQEKQISLVVKGYMPQDCNISSFDLCVIFSNLLSNAIEAAEQCVEKKINLELRHEDDMIMLCIKNTFDGKLEEKNGTIQTRKQDTQVHGYGLENIKECVERNQGQMDIREDKFYFVVTIYLQNI